MGKTGDLLLETAASLTILLIITGIYLWWKKTQKCDKNADRTRHQNKTQLMA